MSFGALDILIILLITVGPTKAMVVYAHLTEGAEPPVKRVIAVRAVLVATIVLLTFVFLGEAILHAFHVSIAALKLAGGLILLLFALHMVAGDPVEAKPPGAAKEISLEIAHYPLAMPLLATPQGIVAVVTLAAGMHSVGQSVLLGALVLLVMAFDLMVLLFADRILRVVGPAVLQVIARVVGLLLRALAMQLGISALRDLGVLAPAAAA